MNLEAMSGSCDSLRTNSLTSPTTSFFDTASISYNFWKYKAKEEDCAIHQKIVENTFIIRSKSFFKEWDSCILSISGSLLVYKKKKDEQKVKYIDFEDHMYRLEVITQSHKKYSAKYPHAFLIRANGNTMEFFCKEQDQYDNWITHLKKFCILINFTENYKTKKILGTGGYGKVYALERLADNRMFAGKFIKFSPNVSKERQRAMIINEIKILRKFNHAQISELYEVYEMTGQVCLVMELIRGDKLFNLITEKKTLSETTTAFIMKQVLLILSEIQDQDVIHRDIKPENLLYTYDDDGKIRLKLIDFGLATFNKKRDVIRKCGTAGYIAPEILNDRAYNFKADVYSAGAIMYISLTGRPPFFARNYEELLAKNKSGFVNYKGAAWRQLSPEAQDLIQRMLEAAPSYRISLADALNHEWFLKNIAPEDRLDLVEHIFKVVKLNIPQEKNISKIPSSSGQLPYIQKTNAITTSINQKFSGSFYASTVALGIEEHKDLHSFYKVVSHDPSNLSQVSISISNSSVSRNFACSITPKSVIGTHMLGLPNIISSPRRQNPSIRLSLGRQKSSIRYSVQVSVVESLDDLEVGHEDDGSLCSTVYGDLRRNPLRFVNILKRHSCEDLSSENEIISDKRFDTEAVETPRAAFKVAAVNSEIRKQIVEHNW